MTTEHLKASFLPSSSDKGSPGPILSLVLSPNMRFTLSLSRSTYKNLAPPPLLLRYIARHCSTASQRLCGFHGRGGKKTKGRQMNWLCELSVSSKTCHSVAATWRQNSQHRAPPACPASHIYTAIDQTVPCSGVKQSRSCRRLSD